MGTVNITLADGQLGSVIKTNDGICGMILTGAPEGDYAVGTPVLITGMAGLAALGITATGNALAYRQVADFYKEAGDGAQLYLMLVADTVFLPSMVDGENANTATKLLNYAQGKIRLLGCMFNDMIYNTDDLVNSDGINADCYSAVTNMAALANDYFSDQKPFRGIVAGTSFNGNAADLTDMTDGTSFNRVAVVIGDTVAGDSYHRNLAALGLLMGRLAAVPVMRKVSRVRSGAVQTDAAYLGELAFNDPSLAGVSAAIADKGFITWKTYPNTGGFFFSGDDTASATNDDYHFLARGRVIDKTHILAYTTFVQEVDDEVKINADGTLDAGFCKWLSQQIENQINNTMTAKQEISSVACNIDPAQNILSNNILNVVLKIVPVGYASEIDIKLGFNNPAA